jgi:hypothetical protein
MIEVMVYQPNNGSGLSSGARMIRPISNTVGHRQWQNRSNHPLSADRAVQAQCQRGSVTEVPTYPSRVSARMLTIKA